MCAGLSGGNGGNSRLCEIRLVLDQKHGAEIAGAGIDGRRERRSRDVDGPTEMHGPGWQRVREWRPSLQAQGMRIGKYAHLLQVDRAELVAQVPEAVMQKRPCRRGFAAPRVTGEQNGFAFPEDGCGVQEQ